jgi:hypothetical protein
MAHRSVTRAAEDEGSTKGAQRHISAEKRARWSALQKMIPSSVWQAAYAEGFAEGRAEGLAEGRAESLAEGGLAVFRDLCREQVRRHHPALLESAGPLIDACDDLGRLKAWFLRATEYDDEGYARFLGLG